MVGTKVEIEVIAYKPCSRQQLMSNVAPCAHPST
jgi:hypothetical protein